ncbi:MAG: CCA tRNA nucleotidyltransferase, partial [Hyphomonadaceae bacterium]
MTQTLPHAAWLTDAKTQAVIAALDAARPHAQRFVGGCVRNTLIGQPVDDIDIATQLTPDRVIAAAKAAGLDAVPTGVEHGTITVICAHAPFEITTLRRDVSTDGRRATVAFTEDWAEDAARRDFRMNALYAEPSGRLHDPTGGGVADALAGRVHFIGDPRARIREDYLRILRFFRFFAWYGRGDPDPDGLAACAELRAGLAQLSAERVWKETKKLLSAADPRAAFTAMETSGARAAILPEAQAHERFAALVEIDAAQGLPGDALARLAVLLPEEAEVARAVARRFKVSNEERARLVAALDPAWRAHAGMTLREARRALYALGPEAFRDRVLRAWAEATPAADAAPWRVLLAEAELWVRPRLPLSGEEVIAAGVPPGPKVGETLRAVEAWWVEADFP